MAHLTHLTVDLKTKRKTYTVILYVNDLKCLIIKLHLQKIRH